MSYIYPAQLTALDESLRRRFELAVTQMTIAGRRYDLLRPRNIDDLISEEDFDIDERIPYWAECWPSGRVLAERLARERGRRRSLLELGCGIGLVSLVAADAGFCVLATDYYADALEFTFANAKRHGYPALDTRLVDWRRLPDDLGTFDVVVAADVLYERPQVALVASTLARTLAPGGLGIVCDPGRGTSDGFVERCLESGLEARLVDRVRTEDADAGLTISVLEVRRLSDA